MSRRIPSARRGFPEPAAGFTLVEVIVALLLLEVFLFGALLSIRLGADRVGRALILEHAIWDAASLADSLSYHGADASASRDRAWGWLEATREQVAARDSSGRLLVSLEVAP